LLPVLLKFKQQGESKSIGKRIVFLESINVRNVNANNVVSETCPKIQELSISIVWVLIEVSCAERKKVAVPVLEPGSNRKLLNNA
jgi:hypothetical protein